MASLSDLAQTPTPRMLGSGLAQMAGSKMALRKPYQDYVLQAQENGEEPIPFEEWAAKLNNS